VAGILDGIKVIDMGHFVAVPSAAAVLADWGADVIKIEPTSGEPQRGVMALAASPVNWRFEVHNRNKRSLAIDLKTESGREVFHRLVAGADVFVTNYQRATLAQLAADHATLSRLNPALIYNQLSIYKDMGNCGAKFAVY
jgi:crotonobetainyl-CoA:carnitine CoA-transferase CaiB-like acyl-CoA transferase